MKKKKATPILDLHFKWLETGRLPSHGLCFSLKENYPNANVDLDIFQPTPEQLGILHYEGFSISFWGAGIKINYADLQQHTFAYTELRQNIMLFLAAMNEEI